MEAYESIAGVDAAYRDDGQDTGAAAVAVTVRLCDLRVVDVACSAAARVAEYLPGRFAAREGDLVVRALRALRREPDVVICHGHGVAHPERFGLACWVGRQVRRPTLGCCQNLLCGSHVQVGPQPGDRADVVDHGEVVGAAVRVHRNMNPVYVSVGFDITLEHAVSVVMALRDRFRLPLPLRLADVMSRKWVGSVPGLRPDRNGPPFFICY